MRWTTPVLATLVALTGCGAEDPPTDWQMVGVYDAAALVEMEPSAEEEEGSAAYVWVPSGGMRKSCGPAKAPDGLGVFEAAAMANRLSPTLAILLERVGEGEEPMTPADVRVSIGRDGPDYRLQPAVSPRYISVTLRGDAELRHKQSVRTQLQMELCMEHKTGRGWVGGGRTQLRQAFLLDPPDAGGPDRKFFGGQRDPVPALLGPPDACLQRAPDLDTRDSEAGRGEGSLDLVPSDVWGASLRWCNMTEVGGSDWIGTGPVSLTVGETRSRPNRRVRPMWRDLVATLHDGPTDLDVTVDLEWDGEMLLENHPLLSQPVDEEGRPTGLPGVTDLLQRVPHEYPVVGTFEDPERYTVLLVPNWQVVEGLRRLNIDQPDDPMANGGEGTQDGIGWLLDNPEYLYVQLPPGDDAGMASGEGDDEIWLNVAEPLAGGPMGINRWGYTPGMLSGRSPVVLMGMEVPSWKQVLRSHHAPLHATFLAAFVLLFGLILMGLQRIGDLWANVPEERVDFWPSAEAGQAEEEGGTAPEAPEMGGGGG